VCVTVAVCAWPEWMPVTVPAEPQRDGADREIAIRY